MEVKEALDLMRKVCAEYRGNLKEHQILQKAIETIGNTITELEAAVPKVECKKIKVKETT